MSLCPDEVLRSAHPGETLAALNVLVTRYNLVLPHYRRKAGIGAPTRYRAWLDTRLKLFETYCLPSVLNQSMPPDLWVLGLDGADRAAVEPVLDLVKGHPWIVPAWQRESDGVYEPYKACLARAVMPLVPDACSHVIVSRLDNDDSLNRSFINYVTRYAGAVSRMRPELEDFWIAFPFGVDYFKRRCWLYVYPDNMFPARVQTREGFLRDPGFFQDHSRIALRGETVFQPLTTEPMWLHTAHGQNVSEGRAAQRRRITLAPTRLVLNQFGVGRGKWPRLASRLAAARWWKSFARR